MTTEEKLQRLKKQAKMENYIRDQNPILRGALSYSPIADKNRGLIKNEGGKIGIRTQREYIKLQKESGLIVGPKDYRKAITQLHKDVRESKRTNALEEAKFWKKTNINRLIGMYKGRVDAENPSIITDDEIRNLRRDLKKLSLEDLSDLVKETYKYGQEGNKSKVDANGNVFTDDSEGKSASYYPPSYREYIDTFLGR